jgi:inner membrane protein
MYCRAVLSSGRLALLIGSLLAALYGYLYVLMQLQDYALLLGSLGLFVILATTMYVTRKIDWFSIGRKLPS